jgi:hypothetical protein|tara:strand:+ start:507 stop:875 length:369 start_codon:yes stop_codon:yes gene_type:complete
MSTEYLSLNDSRPELMSGRTTYIPDEIISPKSKSSISINENKFMNMNLNQILNKLLNILPDSYNDYYTKYLESKVKLKMMDENVSESNIFRETLYKFLFENENIIYLGLLVLIIVFFLYTIN